MNLENSISEPPARMPDMDIDTDRMLFMDIDTHLVCLSDHLVLETGKLALHSNSCQPRQTKQSTHTVNQLSLAPRM